MSNTMIMLIAALGAEVLLLLMAFLGISYLRQRAATGRDRKAVKALIGRVKAGKAEREQAIEAFLTQNMGMAGEAMTAAKVAILRAEHALLQRFAAVYRNREAAMAARFDGDLAAALAPYHALSGTAAGIDADGTDPPVDGAEIEVLRKENARLSDELRITMETMSRMLNEYSTMFSGNQPGRQEQASTGSVAAAAAAAGERPESALDPPPEPEPVTEPAGQSEPVTHDAMLSEEAEVAMDVAEPVVADGPAGAPAGDAVTVGDDGLPPIPDGAVLAEQVDAMEVTEAVVAVDPDEAPAADTVAGLNEGPLQVSADAEDAIDVVAEVLRAAESQEQSARGGLPDGDAAGSTAAPGWENGRAETGGADEDAVEVVGLDTADLAVLDEDLFDAVGTDPADASADGAISATTPSPPGGAGDSTFDDDLFDVGEQPVRSRSQG